VEGTPILILTRKLSRSGGEQEDRRCVRAGLTLLPPDSLLGLRKACCPERRRRRRRRRSWG
jgi:hypothetical protein